MISSILGVFIKIYSTYELEQLWNSCPNPDEFGPDSYYPYLACELGGVDKDIAAWLGSLPCPVIGVGSGNLSMACDIVLPSDEKTTALSKNIEAYPMASMVLVQLLRAAEHLSVKDGLTVESFAYGILQTGPEFQAWLAGYSRKALEAEEGLPLLVDMEEDKLNLVFNRPKSQNAIGVEMRDALCEALDLALADSSIKRITLTGQGKCFSTGGAVEEFGQAADSATAHWVRSLRLPASRMAKLRDRLQIHVNGAAIGAGAEILGFASQVTASENAWFQLPELKYGLIPGAGGTAGLPIRIGRQRLAYWALSMERINAKTALDWGLVDEIV